MAQGGRGDGRGAFWHKEHNPFRTGHARLPSSVHIEPDRKAGDRRIFFIDSGGLGRPQTRATQGDKFVVGGDPRDAGLRGGGARLWNDGPCPLARRGVSGKASTDTN